MTDHHEDDTKGQPTKEGVLLCKMADVAIASGDEERDTI
jgi:hypothetical protein